MLFLLFIGFSFIQRLRWYDTSSANPDRLLVFCGEAGATFRWDHCAAALVRDVAWVHVPGGHGPCYGLGRVGWLEKPLRDGRRRGGRHGGREVVLSCESQDLLLLESRWIYLQHIVSKFK